MFSSLSKKYNTVKKRVQKTNYRNIYIKRYYFALTFSSNLLRFLHLVFLIIYLYSHKDLIIFLNDTNLF